jgi:hypothetical protein|tara:strand:- start:697 stop:870 length:174 start_codon:yes stop_codon:yes gene_type:complete
MSDIEFALVSIFTLIGIVGLSMFFSIQFTLGYLSDILEEMHKLEKEIRKLNQNKEDE